MTELEGQRRFHLREALREMPLHEVWQEQHALVLRTGEAEWLVDGSYGDLEATVSRMEDMLLRLLRGRK